MQLRSILTTISLFAAAASTSFPQQPETSQAARRILQKNCISCHGAAQMSGLDLRTRGAMLQGGTRGAAIVPGNAAASLLYQAVLQTGDVKMPMGRERLSPEDVKTLETWINEGAYWRANTEPGSEPE